MKALPTFVNFQAPYSYGEPNAKERCPTVGPTHFGNVLTSTQTHINVLLSMLRSAHLDLSMSRQTEHAGLLTGRRSQAAKNTKNVRPFTSLIKK